MPMEKTMIPPVIRAQIAQNLLGSLPAAEKGRTPCVYAMAGIPGSGKSTFVKNALDRHYFPREAFILNPDIVMEQIQPYRRDKDLLGAEAAFTKWEMPSRVLAYELAREAGTKRHDIIKDMGMVRAENWRMLMDLRAKGYKIVLHHIVCDVDVAVARCAGRDRYFSAQKVYERARELDTLLADFSDICDSILRFDNSDLANPFIPLPSIGLKPYQKTA